MVNWVGIGTSVQLGTYENFVFSACWKDYANCYNLQQHRFQHNQIDVGYDFVNLNSGTHT